MKICANCRTNIPDTVQPWQRCRICGREFCGYCGHKMVDNTMMCVKCRGEKVQVKSIM